MESKNHNIKLPDPVSQLSSAISICISNWPLNQNEWFWFCKIMKLRKLFQIDLESVTFHYRILMIKLASTVGILMNIFNICFLTKNRNEMNLNASFLNLLILLAIFDTLFLVTGIGLLGLPAVFDWYNYNILNQILPKG